jgi:hypothetical protein
MAHVIWAAANGLMLLLFLFSVSVQFNDPDPVRWVVIYGLAAAATGLELAGRATWWLSAPVGVVALLWAFTFIPRVGGRVPLPEMFSAWEMKNLEIEESREMYGLAIVAVWMAALTFANWR